MAEENDGEVQGQDENLIADEVTDTGTDNSSSPEVSGDDLYASYLEKFPTSLHGIARDVFKEWDGNVTKRIQEVHSEYEPYKEVVQEWEPEALRQAINLAAALDNDPQAFYTAIAEAYGFETPQQGQQIAQELQQQQAQPEVDEFDPMQQRLTQHEELLRTMAETIIGERTAKQQAEQERAEDELYDNTMAELTTKHGEFDQGYVNALLQQGIDPEAAVLQWKSALDSYAQKQLAPNTTAPVVMGSGGGTPSIQRDVGELSTQETRSLVEAMLRQAAES